MIHRSFRYQVKVKLFVIAARRTSCGAVLPRTVELSVWLKSSPQKITLSEYTVVLLQFEQAGRLAWPLCVFTIHVLPFYKVVVVAEAVLLPPPASRLTTTRCDAEAVVAALSARYRFSRANAVQLLRDEGILRPRAEAE